jgi:hypothetical protein
MSRILIVFGTKVDMILDKCNDCPMQYYDDDYAEYCCILSGEQVRFKGFPSHCPLPEVPDNPNKKEEPTKGLFRILGEL